MTRAIGVSLASAGLAIAVLGCSGEPPQASPRTPVRVAIAGPADGPGALRYSAALVPAAAVPVSFKLPGYVAEIASVRDATGRTRMLQEGDRVRRGQTLARVGTDDFVAKVNQARSQQGEVEAALSQARQAYERAAALYETKSLTRGDYDAARSAYDTVRARKDGVTALVSEAENALTDAAIRSPLDGIVLNRMIEVGTLVGAGTPGFVVADITAVKVRFGAPELVTRRLALGQPQAIVTETYPNERFEGRITSLAPAADPGSLVFDVEITIPNADGRLKPGMVASVAIQDEERSPEVVLPLAAIVRSPTQPDGYAVFVVEPREGTTHARLREVTLGRMVSNGVAVTAGLGGGEQVIVTGARMVADGEVVEILR
jgi:membrane fusion protein, multidrug efflux system